MKKNLLPTLLSFLCCIGFLVATSQTAESFCFIKYSPLSRWTFSQNEGTGTPEKKRNFQRKLVVTGTIAGYAAASSGLYLSWYKGYPFGKFHFVNDNKNWLQVDKAGHAWSNYIQGRIGIELWQFAGYSHKKAVWIAGLSGLGYQSLIEISDGLSSHWGFSWGDYVADVAGCGLVIGQELGWKEQRISYKFSTHRIHYNEELLAERADEIYGKSLAGRLLNDYNAQTYWLSVNLKSFFKKSHLPPWLNVSFSYGADGMFGERDNNWTNKNGVEFNRNDLKRIRQFYISPDIDFSRIRSKSKILKTALFILNSFKFPAPAMELSNNQIRFHWLVF